MVGKVSVPLGALALIISVGMVVPVTMSAITGGPKVGTGSFFENFNTTENILSLENLVVDTSTGKVMLAKIGEGIFTATQRTTSAYSKEYPQLQVVGDTIHYVWREYDGSKYRIWTARMNVDGSGWTATQRTTSAYSKGSPQLQVVGDTIHYVWYEDDGSNLQIWTATLVPGYALSGALVSKPFDAGSGFAGWGTISWEGA